MKGPLVFCSSSFSFLPIAFILIPWSLIALHIVKFIVALFQEGQLKGGKELGMREREREIERERERERKSIEKSYINLFFQVQIVYKPLPLPKIHDGQQKVGKEG